MFQKLIALVSSDFPLNESDIQLCKNYFRPTVAKKNELLVEAGETAAYLYFINSGFMRVFHVSKGVEVTTQLACSGDFVTAFGSFISVRAAQENVQCVSNCQMLQISKHELDQLYAGSKNWASLIRHVYKRSIEQDEKRAKEILLTKPEERYRKLIEKQAEIFENVPVQVIASYLGMQSDTLAGLDEKRRKAKP